MLFFRVIWALLVIGTFSIFTSFVVGRYLYMIQNPKTVDVEVIYVDSVRFPTVTICNQNLFRYVYVV